MRNRRADEFFFGGWVVFSAYRNLSGEIASWRTGENAIEVTNGGGISPNVRAALAERPAPETRRNSGIPNAKRRTFFVLTDVVVRAGGVSLLRHANYVTPTSYAVGPSRRNKQRFYTKRNPEISPITRRCITAGERDSVALPGGNSDGVVPSGTPSYCMCISLLMGSRGKRFRRSAK